MRHLWILRHAKAAPGGPGGDDHGRPLTPRGHRQGNALGALLPSMAAAGRVLPTVVLCSTARRARETADDVVPWLGDGVRVEVERGLYDADVDDVLELVRLVPDDAASVMVVGHNPTLHDLAFDLLAPDDEQGRRRLDAGFPTAALAIVRVDVDTWPGLGPGTGTLETLVVPERH